MNDTQSAIISLMLIYPNRIDEIVEKTSASWFTGEHLRAYEFLCAGDGDAVSLHKHTGITPKTIAEWTEVSSSMYGLNKHVKNAENEFIARSLNQLGQQLLHSDNNEDALRMIDTFNNDLSVMEKVEPVSAKEGLGRLYKELERRSEQDGIMGTTYGLDDLDAATEGMHDGDLIVVAAPSSMGKTAFACAVVEAACKAGVPALMFSAEMTVEQLLMRSMSSNSRVPMKRMRSANFEEQDWDRMTGAFQMLAKLNFWIDETAGIQLSELIRKAKRYVKKHGVKLIMIDYLQIMGYDKNKEVTELDMLTTALKCLAKELKLPIIILSQVNRSNSKENRKPTMTDLRGSGMIENNADVILMPWRPAANCQKCQDNITDADHEPAVHKKEAEIIIAKQRQGERNITIPVLWREEIVRFDNLPI